MLLVCFVYRMKKETKQLTSRQDILDVWVSNWTVCRVNDDGAIDRLCDDCVITQYTWLKDKNWVEIYEGRANLRLLFQNSMREGRQRYYQLSATVRYAISVRPCSTTYAVDNTYDFTLLDLLYNDPHRKTTSHPAASGQGVKVWVFIFIPRWTRWGHTYFLFYLQWHREYANSIVFISRQREHTRNKLMVFLTDNSPLNSTRPMNVVFVI